MAPFTGILQNLRVALIHHWLVRMRGGEKVLESLCSLFPQADIYTLVFDPKEIADSIKRHSITTSWIQKLPFATRHYSKYLPLFPLAIEQFDLSAYDLVLSSEAAVGKGAITRPETCHICYCHAPLRYAWSAYHTYLQAVRNPWKRALAAFLMSYLRTWDTVASGRVDYYIANSETVSRRIQKYYRRESVVIYPPIATSSFQTSSCPADYYLAVGQLTPYKRFDLAVDAFNELGRPLLIVGEGPEFSHLKKRARKNITLTGRVSNEVLRKHLSQCRALIFPGEEDFGMIAVEAHASGRPVIALSRGGAVETVISAVNGLLFEEETAASLASAVQQFEAAESRFEPLAIKQTAAPFDVERFEQQLTRFVCEKVQEHRDRFKVGRRQP
jgi:glycosyltransferase involved in cell wall biosynthesis